MVLMDSMVTTSAFSRVRMALGYVPDTWGVVSDTGSAFIWSAFEVLYQYHVS